MLQYTTIPGTNVYRDEETGLLLYATEEHNLGHTVHETPDWKALFDEIRSSTPSYEEEPGFDESTRPYAY